VPCRFHRRGDHDDIGEPLRDRRREVPPVRIAIVGGGVSGLVAAYGLHPHHEVTVLELERRLGGHAHTVCVDDGPVQRRLDTGFLIFNRRDYP
jgi:predicted NAD/FAD-binding protein